jgi:hypothetical protein
MLRVSATSMKMIGSSGSWGWKKPQQVRIDRPPLRSRAQALQELLAHFHQCSGAAGRHVEATEQLAAQRLDRCLQPREILRRRVGLVGDRALRDRFGHRRVIARQQVEELVAAVLVERLVGVERLARQRHAGVLTAHRE